LGRKKGYKKNLNAYITSVSSKTLHSWLMGQTRTRFGVALQEADLISQKAELFLSESLGVTIGNQFTISLPPIASMHAKRSYDPTCSLPVRLTAYGHDDLELLSSFGLKSMQNARIFRNIEEALYQGTYLTYQHLCMLSTTTAKSLRERLKPLWNEGISLPVGAVGKKHRSFTQLRPTYVLTHYLAGNSLAKLQQQLCFSTQLWELWVQQFLAVCIYDETCPALNPIPSLLVSEYRKLFQTLKSSPAYKNLLAGYTHLLPASTNNTASPQELFVEDLAYNHGFSKAKSNLYIQMLSEFEHMLSQLHIPSNSIIYFATADSESPAKTLALSSTIPTIITWWDEEDFQHTSKDSTTKLKWRKILRFSTLSSNYSASLTQYDLAFLLAMHPGVIQKAAKEHQNVLLPLRGNISDIGPGISHAEKIITLYLQGYTETEIVRRAGHTYQSIENYLIMFSRVVAMLDRGMPLPLVRQTIGCSLRLVEKHAQLYAKFDVPDYQFSLMQIRRIFERQPSAESKKKSNKKGTIWDA